MKILNTLLLVAILGVFTSLNIMAQNVDVTFQVDMTGETVGDNGLAVAGQMNDWSIDDHLTLNSETGLYEITMNLPIGDRYEFKYVNLAVGGTDTIWGDVAGLCSYRGTNSRAIRIPDTDVQLDPVTFAGCIDGKNSMVNMIFQVDMSNDSITVSPNGVHMAGSFYGDYWWNPGGLELTDPDGDGIYADTLAFVPGDEINYKFINGNSWDGQENSDLIPDTIKIGGNRGAFIPESLNDTIAMPVIPWLGSPALYSVTFNITDTEGVIVEDATLDIFGKTYHITENGDTIIGYPTGYYPLSLTAPGYYDYSGSIYVNDQDIADASIVLESAVKSLELSIEDDSNYVSPAVMPTITTSHALLLSDGGVITNDNITDLLTFADANGDVPFSATINATKDIITIIPDNLLSPETIYTYGIKDNVLMYNDPENVVIGDTLVSFTVNDYTLETYFDFDGINQVTEFKSKVASDHVGHEAQPYYTSSPASADDKALRYKKGLGSWGGWGKLEIDLNAPIDLSSGKIFSFDVYSPITCEVRFAVTDTNNSEGDIQVETGGSAPFDVEITKINEWQTVYVDLSEGNFVDTIDYQHILIMFNAGVDHDTTYYIDNFKGPALLEDVVSIENEIAQNLKLYPNPARNNITIEAETIIESIELYNMNGQRILLNNAINSAQVNMDVSSFNTGIYFVKAETAGSVKILKFVIE